MGTIDLFFVVPGMHAYYPTRHFQNDELIRTEAECEGSPAYTGLRVYVERGVVTSVEVHAAYFVAGAACRAVTVMGGETYFRAVRDEAWRRWYAMKEACSRLYHERVTYQRHRFYTQVTCRPPSRPCERTHSSPHTLLTQRDLDRARCATWTRSTAKRVKPDVERLERCVREDESAIAAAGARLNGAIDAAADACGTYNALVYVGMGMRGQRTRVLTLEERAKLAAGRNEAVWGCDRRDYAVPFFLD